MFISRKQIYRSLPSVFDCKLRAAIFRAQADPPSFVHAVINYTIAKSTEAESTKKAIMSVSIFVSYEPDGSPPLPDKDRRPLNIMVSKQLVYKAGLGLTSLMIFVVQVVF